MIKNLVKSEQLLNNINWVFMQLFIKTKRLINQFGSNLKEVAYHRKVRIRAIKRGGTIVDGTILETKSKYPINTFENESSKEVSKQTIKTN